MKISLLLTAVINRQTPTYWGNTQLQQIELVLCSTRDFAFSLDRKAYTFSL